MKRQPGFITRCWSAIPTPAEDILSEGGIRVDTATRFGLGYAPDYRTALYKMLSKTYNQEDILRSGLVRKNDAGEIYDFFRNRVMFPVFDNNGDVVAFGGKDVKRKVRPQIYQLCRVGNLQ